MAKDDHATIESLVRLGARLRSRDLRQATTNDVIRAIGTSRNSQLVGLLSYTLSAYGEFPEGLMPSLIGSPSIPAVLVPSLAIAETLTSIPAEWGDGRQIAFWEQFFLQYPAILPDLHDDEMVRMRPQLESGWCVTSPRDILDSIPSRKLSNPSTINAIFQRALHEDSLGAWMLRALQPSVALGDAGVADGVGALWATNPAAIIRCELVNWLSEAPRPVAERELFKIYCAESNTEARKQVGSVLITGDSAPTTFRTLWTRERSEDVQLALIHALGFVRTDASLNELARVHATGTEVIRAAVEWEILDQFRDLRDESAERLLLQYGVVVPAPSTTPRLMLPPYGK